MIFTSSQKASSLLTGAVIIAHLVAFFFAPWFHLHPGEDYADLNGEFYHSHTMPFTSHAPEPDQDEQHQDAIMHLFAVRSQPLDEMHGFFQVNFGNIINPAKCAPNLDFFNLPSTSISQYQFVFQNTTKFLIHPLQQNYFVLNATNLSPPQA